MWYYPELDSVFYDYWMNRGVFTVHQLPIPEAESLALVPSDSVFRMLFGESYSEDHYVYKFSEVSKSTFPPATRTRLYSTNKVGKCLVTDSTGENTLNLGADDLAMLDVLHVYRVSGSDATSELASVDYVQLSTPLAKLIYNYLDLMLNGVVYSYESDSLLSENGTLLEQLLEAYVVNEACREIQTYDGVVGTDLQTPSLTIEQRFLLETSPAPGTRLVLFKNGQIVSSLDIPDNTLTVTGLAANSGDAYTLHYTQEPYVSLDTST